VLHHRERLSAGLLDGLKEQELWCHKRPKGRKRDASVRTGELFIAARGASLGATEGKPHLIFGYQEERRPDYRKIVLMLHLSFTSRKNALQRTN
jgi:hypothetical protein